MPYKTGKMKGELTTPEIRRLVKAHNKLTSIKFPKGAKREQIIKIINDSGFKINHEKQSLIPSKRPRLKEIKLGKTENRRGKGEAVGADDILPKPKTAEEKKEAKKQRDMKKKQAEDKIKAEGVKQGAALQRVISKKKKALKKITSNKTIQKKENMGDTAFIKKQKQLQLEKQKETRRALLKQKVKVDKTTRRGKPVKKEESPVKKGDLKEQMKEAIQKIIKKYSLEGDTARGKDNKYVPKGQKPIDRDMLTKKGDKFKIRTEIKTQELLDQFFEDEIKPIPVLNDNLILGTAGYDNGKKIPVLFSQGKAD